MCGATKAWQKLMKHGRLLKEVNEALPVVDRLERWVRCNGSDNGKLTIVQLVAGMGALSMLLAEMLAGNANIERFVLVDNAYPLPGTELKAHHVNPAHLALADCWPFELTHRKYDIKSSSGHRSLQKHCLDRAPGPIALLGVHLCGVLSLRAVQLYNDHPRCALLAMKPCCLPPMCIGQWQCV